MHIIRVKVESVRDAEFSFRAIVPSFQRGEEPEVPKDLWSHVMLIGILR
jgi:hypothetical protein